MRAPEAETRRTVSHLIQDLEDGSISAEDRETLMTLMRERPQVRELYLRHVELAALLHQSAESRAQLGTMPVSQEMLKREKRKSAITAFSYGIAALLVLGIGLLLYQVSLRLPNDRDFVELVGSADAHYSLSFDEEDRGGDGRLRPGDEIILARGLVQCTFASGVEAIVEGPSRLEIVSDTTVHMDGGLGWFRVPEEGRGFTVRTDRARIVDLGTEFGVWFDGSRGLQVHVRKGRVVVDPSVPGPEDTELAGGDAMSFDLYGNSRPVTLKTSLFRTQFLSEVPYLHWSFDRLVDGAFPARGSLAARGDYAARLMHLEGGTPSSDCRTEGRFGRAFSMKGDGLFAESGFPGIGGNAPRTVAAWVRHRGAGKTFGVIKEKDADPVETAMTGHGAVTPHGEQAYLLNYTNSGLTTAAGAIDAVLEPGVTYALAFDAAALPGAGGAVYHVELVAFGAEVGDDRRLSCRPPRSGTRLASATGTVSTSDFSDGGRVEFRADPGDPSLGMELGIRLIKDSGSILYDNLRLTAGRGAAESAAELVFAEGFETPRVMGFAPNTVPAAGWVGTTDGFGSERRGLFNERSILHSPYAVWGAPGPGRSWGVVMNRLEEDHWSTSIGSAWNTSRIGEPSEEWVHVATVYTGLRSDSGYPEIIHYINGDPQECRSSHLWPWGGNDPVQVDTGVTSADAGPLRFGAMPGARRGDRTVNGDLDELFLFRGVLDEGEIRHLMERNQPRLSGR